MTPPKPEQPCPRCEVEWMLWGIEKTAMDTERYLWYCPRCHRVQPVEVLNARAIREAAQGLGR